MTKKEKNLKNLITICANRNIFVIKDKIKNNLNPQIYNNKMKTIYNLLNKIIKIQIKDKNYKYKIYNKLK